jgi:hypothetical protein
MELPETWVYIGRSSPETVGKKIAEKKLLERREKWDFCHVLSQFAHDKGNIAVFQAKVHTAKVSLPCSLSICTRRRFHAKMLRTWSFEREKFAGGEGVRGRRELCRTSL